MKGRTVAGIIAGAALIAGGSIYYLQVYAFYKRLDPGSVSLTFVPKLGGAPVAIPVSGLQAIDARSSPLRFRACFTVTQTPEELAGTYQAYTAPEPLNGPGWFDCFDTGLITEALQTGGAAAFLSERDIGDGVDRVIAVFPDGRAFAWHQLNEKYRD